MGTPHFGTRCHEKGCGKQSRRLSRRGDMKIGGWKIQPPELSFLCVTLDCVPEYCEKQIVYTTGSLNRGDHQFVCVNL